jgi:hypothetical protein
VVELLATVRAPEVEEHEANFVLALSCWDFRMILAFWSRKPRLRTSRYSQDSTRALRHAEQKGVPSSHWSLDDQLRTTSGDPLSAKAL